MPTNPQPSDPKVAQQVQPNIIAPVALILDGFSPLNLETIR